ncbi:uncharacterized protein SCHCODRAFT_02357517 [Schizophyllum commune H4-8]|uniref:uncharacterized protein n=1 Tax=Schizophyllum commune (strain H4-8 / FGSC 9210) TaxID=578458 RepID=UPI002160DEFB|nr:uncharacterized protein SCHCODRAFT_02357517 [Schizophyllum commune H4-8]KAI5889013.1 hypothetical protein SCHCODRAFT_02357517 [Schizophyllum commune H4-8]
MCPCLPLSQVVAADTAVFSPPACALVSCAWSRLCTATDETYRHRRSPASSLSKAIDGQIDAADDSMHSALLRPALNVTGGFEWASSTIRHLALDKFESTWSTKFELRHRLAATAK